VIPASGAKIVILLRTTEPIFIHQPNWKNSLNIPRQIGIYDNRLSSIINHQSFISESLLKSICSKNLNSYVFSKNLWGWIGIAKQAVMIAWVQVIRPDIH